MAEKEIIDCIHLYCTKDSHTHTNKVYLIFNRKLMFYITFRLFHLARTEHDNSQVLHVVCEDGNA